MEVPKGIIRPAMDSMRESVFATLGNLTDSSFLDLFSGSGIIALEAASRGATHIEAVESDVQKRKTLLKNVSMAPVRIHCHFQPAENYIKRAKRGFSYIFCDPPFNYRFKWDLLHSIMLSPLAETGSLILLHRPREDAMPLDLLHPSGMQADSAGPDPDTPALFYLEQTKTYGRSQVDFIRKQ